MLSFADQSHVYFARDPVDMRKQIDGLTLLVQEAFELDPFSPAAFAFCNRQRDKIKIVFWHGNGFCLLYKRIEKKRFQWPKLSNAIIPLTMRELSWLLDGLSLDTLKARQELVFKAV
jgi:transposase